MLPLQFGSVQEFALLREYLADFGYTEKNICSTLGVRAMHELVGSLPPERARADGACGVLCGLFIASRPAGEAALRASIPSAVLDAMIALGLLRPSDAPSTLEAPMALYPASGLYFVSDRWIYPDHRAIENFDDIVFPAISRHTGQFLAALPEDPCEAFLDLCSGTGVAALVAASRYARHAWAVDITERATQCAEFSRRLNGLENVSVIKGDLYDPLAGLTFDRIVAHPPYVPVLQPGRVYYDGGEDGERVTRQIVEGLPSHLALGGRFICLSMGIERENERFEQRARNWLKDASGEFDILYVLHRVEDLIDFAYQSTVHVRGDLNYVERWKAHFRNLKVKDLVTGALIVERHATARSPFTLRCQKGDQTGPLEAGWRMRLEAESSGPPGLERLKASKPVASTEIRLQAVHRIERGEFTPVSLALETDYPFSMECKVQPWMPLMVARCDGNSTVEELFEACRQDGLIHAETPVAEFVQLVRTFIAGGFLKVDEFPLPRNGSNRL